jgi:hypothetical protein
MGESIFEHAIMIVTRVSVGLPKNCVRSNSRFARHDDVADKFGKEKAGYRSRSRTVAEFLACATR